MSESRTDDNDTFGYSALHELIHWLQHISYTFGGFLTAGSDLRDFYVQHIFSRYRRGSREGGAGWEQFSPFVPTTAAFFDVTLDHGMVAKQLIGWKIAFRDLLLCEKLFLSLSLLDSIPTPSHEFMQPELLIPRCLVRIHNWARQILCYSSSVEELPYDASNPLRLQHFSRVVHDGLQLDTVDILESMPVVAEISTQLKQGQTTKAAQRWAELIDTHYIRALSIFMAQMGYAEQHAHVQRFCDTFLAIAEMSLNPPLPPFGVMGKLELDWRKIYPPIRFVELCQVAKDLRGVFGRDDSDSDDDLAWRPEWSAKISAAYLSRGGALSYLDRDKEGYLPKTLSLPFLHMIAAEDEDVRKMLIWKDVYDPEAFAQSDIGLNNRRGLELYAMMRHGHILSMNWLGMRNSWMIPYELRRWNRRFLPPLVVLPDGTIVTGGWSQKLAAHLIDRNLIFHQLHDIILGIRPAAEYLAQIPTAIAEEIRARARGQLQELI